MGWFGALLAYLAFDIAATFGHSIASVRVSYAAMEFLATAVIVPLAIATVLVGALLALSSKWGLARHYWVLAKLVLTGFAVIVLLFEVSTVRALSAAALSSADIRELPGTLPHSIGGLVVLAAALVLSVVKPRGLTPHGWRRNQAQESAR
ncbi:DUF2269 domain-containing protein [Agrococcus beijingensis]|uniref:DUF2269 domain-containing protein n=1 Tax=Agrococcus beijingensis TaxID=3068634 RepID=UPI00274060DB|nr:DUF2269 domain-containing protein [Agrococcus sp. REN33]